MGIFDSTVREWRLRLGEIERLMEKGQAITPSAGAIVINLAIDAGLHQGRCALITEVVLHKQQDR